MLTREQLLGNNIGVADNFDEEFITRFKLEQKILVNFKISGIIYHEIIMLGKDNHYFFRYELCQCDYFNFFISDNTIFEYRNGLYTRLQIKKLSLNWLKNFMEWGKNFSD